MTIDDRYLIDLTDINAVSLECSQCGASLNVKVEKWLETHTVCSGCGFQVMVNGSDQQRALQRLALGLREAIAQRPSGDKTGYRVRFEISRPK